MKLSTDLSGLVLLSLLSAAEATLPWPYNLPADAKYWPGDAPKARRDVAQKPVGVRKMDGDEGAKFFLHYWGYEGNAAHEQPPEHPLPPRGLVPRAQHYANASMPIPYAAPMLLHAQTSPNPHYGHGKGFLSGILGRALDKRDFKCPTGSAACNDIGRPNTCCNQGEACHIIPDTGLGDVGCCPPGSSCSGNLNNCDLGFTKCSDNLGSGCCIPKYVCVDVGCE